MLITDLTSAGVISFHSYDRHTGLFESGICVSLVVIVVDRYFVIDIGACIL